MAKRSKNKWYERMWMIVLQDTMVSLLASLLSLLLVRWISQPIPGFTPLVLLWLSGSLAGTMAGIGLSGYYKDVRQVASVSAIGKTLLAVLVKEVVLVVILITGLVSLSPVYSVLAILVDLLLTGAFLMYLRMSARLLVKGSSTDVKTKAGSRSALVAGTDDASLLLAARLEREGYSVEGLLTKDRNLAGLVIQDYVVYCCEDPAQMRRLQWQLGGIDCVFFPPVSA